MTKAKIVRVRITKSADERKVEGSLNGKRFSVPVDGQFHTIAANLLPALDDSDVKYEIEQPEPKAPAGGAGGLGGSAAPPNPLDHDGNGRKGGSKKGRLSTRAKGAARKAAARIKKAVGK